MIEATHQGNRVIVKGNVKSPTDSQEIGEAMQIVKQSHPIIILRLVDSISVTSSLIGQIRKTIGARMDPSTIKLDTGNTRYAVELEYGNPRVGEVLDTLMGHLGFVFRKI